MRATLISSLVYAILFVVWRHIQPTGIVFYQGVLLAMLVAAAQALVTARTRTGSHRAVLKDSLLTFLLLYSVVFTIPTTVDRAYSVRMILELELAPNGLTRQEIGQWFATDFQAQGGVQKRLQEQLVTGSLVRNGERYQLTSLGHLFAAAFRWMQLLFATNKGAEPSAPAGSQAAR